jgi:hypothetical protein
MRAKLGAPKAVTVKAHQLADPENRLFQRGKKTSRRPVSLEPLK